MTNESGLWPFIERRPEIVTIPNSKRLTNFIFNAVWENGSEPARGLRLDRNRGCFREVLLCKIFLRACQLRLLIDFLPEHLACRMRYKVVKLQMRCLQRELYVIKPLAQTYSILHWEHERVAIVYTIEFNFVLKERGLWPCSSLEDLNSRHFWARLCQCCLS